MVDKANVELDEFFLKKFFSLTDKTPPEGEINLAILQKQLDESERLLNSLKKLAPAAPKSASAENDMLEDTFGENSFNLPQKSILIIDDLGVITYQLSVLFKQNGFEVTTSKEIYDAIDKFKKQSFELVIMDLFIPTEREGFLLLEELKKIAITRTKPTRIGVMSASPKKEHKQLCKVKGAEFYIEKVDEWQKDLFRVISDLK